MSLIWLPSSDSGIRYQSQLFISTLERTLTLYPNVKVTIIWIPGHVGIVGNELADRTAVAGSTTTFLARQAGRLPSVPNQEGDMPVVLARKKPEEGAQRGDLLTRGVEAVGAEPQLAPPTDDVLVAPAGSLLVAK